MAHPTVTVKIDGEQAGTAELVRGELLNFTGDLEERVLDSIERAIEAGRRSTVVWAEGARRLIAWTIRK